MPTSMDFHGFPWISMDFYGFPWISIELNTKTAECRAARHEIKNFLYETIDLFKPRRLTYAGGSETPQ